MAHRETTDVRYIDHTTENQRRCQAVKAWPKSVVSRRKMWNTVIYVEFQ